MLEGGGSMQKERSDVSTSAEEASDLNGLYQKDLNRPIDPSGLVSWENAIAGGMSQQDVQVSITHSQEEAADVIVLYEDEVARNPSSAEISQAEAELAGGSVTLSALTSGDAYSPESTADLKQEFVNDYDRQPSAYELSQDQQYLAGGGSLEVIRERLGETSASALQTVFENTDDRPASAAEISADETYLAGGGVAGGGSLAVIQASLAESHATQVNIETAIQETFDSPYTNSEAGEVSTFQTYLADGGTMQSVRLQLAEQASGVQNVTTFLNSNGTSITATTLQQGEADLADLSDALAQARNDTSATVSSLAAAYTPVTNPDTSSVLSYLPNTTLGWTELAATLLTLPFDEALLPAVGGARLLGLAAEEAEESFAVTPILTAGEGAGTAAVELPAQLTNDTSIVYNAAAAGAPLLLEDGKTFTASTYIATTLEAPITLYRVWGGRSSQLGSFWTTVKPATSLQAKNDLALIPEWGNTASNVSTITVPAGTTVYSGYAKEQTGNDNVYLPGGGVQVFIMEVLPSWITATSPLPS